MAQIALLGAAAGLGVLATRRYMAGGVCKSKARLDGKVVLITGANTGLGKETAIDLAKRGGRIIMACRSMERAAAAADDVRMLTGVQPEMVKVMKLDLASLKSVRDFAEQYKKEESRLDILINNAGVMFPPHAITEDGFELTFQANHLGHFLLTNLLLDLLKKSAPSRVVSVSSLAHTRASGFDYDDIRVTEDKYNSRKIYGCSKLANIYFTKELAKRLQGTGVTTYALHPGVVSTELLRYVSVLNTPGVSHFMSAVTWPFFKQPKEGAQTQIYCAVEEELASQTGLYYSDCAVKEPTKVAQDEAAAKKLWEVSEQLCGLSH